jgi:hypothetical protein
MSYPETVILAVTTHGEIPTFITADRMHAPVTFELPEGMTLKKVSAVAPGVCNIMHTIDADEYIQSIIDWVKTLKPKELLTEDIGSEVSSYLREEDYENEYIPISRQIQRFKRKQNRKISLADEDDDVPGKEYIQYLDNWNKGYKKGDYYNPVKRLRSSTINPPKTRVLNKIYARRNDSEQFEGVWDFQIIALNVVGYPDIMREIEGRSHKGSSSVRLDEIVKFLHDKGVKNIILIDLSCSSFDDEYNDMDDRTVRLLQRELLSKGLHGGKKKTRRVRKTVKKTTTKGKKTKPQVKKTRRNNK